MQINKVTPGVVKLFTGILMAGILLQVACKKSNSAPANFTYYQIGFKGEAEDWRDTGFVVATADTATINAADKQLLLPVENRQMITGTLAAGSGGYNKNATHEFKWHLKENSWHTADISIELYDGRPYSDVDSNFAYWRDTVKGFAPWSSYIKAKVVR